MEKEKTKPPYHVVSFSGGKDSTAMLLRMIELNMPIDNIVFADTTAEFPAMYEHIEKVEKYISRKITLLIPEQDFEYILLKHKVFARDGSVKQGYSFGSMTERWCTTYFKTRAINKHIRELKNSYEVIEYVGIAADEPKRIKDKNYPLVDWGWTEADALKYCYEKGFDWSGLYELFGRVSCWCCPLKNLDELRKLRKYYPDLWAKLQDWQSKTWRKFRADYSVQELKLRFRLEEERESKGLPTGRNKEFQKALAERLGRTE